MQLINTLISSSCGVILILTHLQGFEFIGKYLAIVVIDKCWWWLILNKLRFLGIDALELIGGG